MALSKQPLGLEHRVVDVLELVVAGLQLLEPVSSGDQGLLLAVPFIDWEPEFWCVPFVAEVIQAVSDPVSAACFGSLVAV